MRYTSWLLLAITLVMGPILRADPCTNTDCTFTFDEHNSFSGITSAGPYGTVELVQTAANAIAFHINMDPNYVLIKTGFAGVFGFNDNMGSAFTIGNFVAPSAYSGSSTSGGLKFDGFGQNWDDAAATSGPSVGDGTAVSAISFTVTKNSGNFANIFDLVALEAPEGGAGPAYFVADVYDKACGSGGGTACTGLVAVSGIPSRTIPEPASTIPAAAGMAALIVIAARKRWSRQTSN